MLISWLGMEN